MGIITDIIKDMPITAVQAEKITELEKRITVLETENTELKTRLKKYEQEAGESCPKCRKPALELKSVSKTIVSDPFSTYLFSCSACGFADEVLSVSAGKAWEKMR